MTRETLIAEYGSPRHQAIVAAVSSGAETRQVAEQFKVNTRTVRRVMKSAESRQAFTISLQDRHSNIPLGTVLTSRGFMHACQHIMRTYSAFFNSLELPHWELVCGEQRVKLADIRAQQ